MIRVVLILAVVVLVLLIFIGCPREVAEPEVAERSGEQEEVEPTARTEADRTADGATETAEADAADGDGDGGEASDGEAEAGATAAGDAADATVADSGAAGGGRMSGGDAGEVGGGAAEAASDLPPAIDEAADELPGGRGGEAAGRLLDPVELPEVEPRRDEADRELRGTWRQRRGAEGFDNAADFAEGGYRESRLHFRDDGSVEIERVFDAEGWVRLTRRYRYRRAAAEVLELSPLREESEGEAGAGASLIREPLELSDSAGGSVRVTPAEREVPVELDLEVDAERGRMVLDGRVYERVR